MDYAEKGAPTDHPPLAFFEQGDAEAWSTD